ncbi:MAG: histidine phosphatase family protein [Bacteroidetes bacterium]|nr:histidine phosphatase family protein [Bacteroidota bacterium]
MKVIHLIRHAKSSWDNPDLDDFSRTLNERGKKDAPFMANKLKELGCNPDYFMSSPAKRTTETSKIIATALSYDIEKTIFDERIYHSSLPQILKVLNEIPNSFNTIILVGHNPTLTQLSNYLTDDFIDNIPTCGIVKIELDIDNWQHIIQGIGRKIFFIYPKKF